MEDTKDFLSKLDAYSKASVDLYNAWEDLKEFNPDLALDVEVEYPFVEEFREVAEQIFNWAERQKELAAEKAEWA